MDGVRHRMGKLFALVLTILTLASVAVFFAHAWWMPIDISTDGPAIDRQIAETMFVSGILFVLAQALLGIFAWKFADVGDGRKITILPGGAKPLVLLAVVIVGAEILALTFVGSKVWADIYMTPAPAGAVKIDVQAQQFAFHFRYAGPDSKFGAIHPELMDDSAGNFFGLDRQSDPAATDDIVASALVVPEGRPILLTLHSRDVGHSFFVPELRIQQDFVPGLIIPVHFTATKTGKYEIVCTQLCGLGHSSMRAFLEVVPQNEFDQWLKEQAAQ
jgi:cytochrome c oxidase subunit 2